MKKLVLPLKEPIILMPIDILALYIFEYEQIAKEEEKNDKSVKY